MQKEVRDEFDKVWTALNRLDREGSRPVALMNAKLDALLEHAKTSQITWRWRVGECVAVAAILVTLFVKK